jgi:hypothetical protein
LHLEPGRARGGPLQQLGEQRFPAGCSAAAADLACRCRAGSSWSWGPWLVITGEGEKRAAATSGGLAARVSRGEQAVQDERLRVGGLGAWG